ncbi:MAG: type II secretion system F family protein [Lachnospiraceae bacterium]|nr:type II secretion system F family protein [Lachnospiraceae bacterium]
MKNKKLAKRLILLIEVIGLLMWGMEALQHSLLYDNTIPRGTPEEGVTEKEFTVTHGNETDTVTVRIHPQARPKKEQKKLLARAKEELLSSYLGENASPKQIDHDLYLSTTYADGAVEATWNLTPGQYVDTSGALRPESIQEPVEVVAEVELRCEDALETLTLPLTIYPLSLDTPEGFGYALEEQLRQADEGHPTEGIIHLPEQVAGVDLTWRERMEGTGMQLCLLGIAAAVGLRAAEGAEERERKKKLTKALQRDYPNIVNWLSLYVGAGISMKQAFAMIGKEATSEHPGYEAILRCYRSMADGKSEMAAYEDLSTYAPEKNYRKLSLLITHHLRKGSEDLMFQLEKEARAAFEQRKILAKVAGEEASTKLLLPMMGLLGIVLVVLIVPALWGINI